jgi:hypothetical protein
VDDKGNPALVQSSADGSTTAVAQMEIDDSSGEIGMLGGVQTGFEMALAPCRVL